jgi:hypothetical protein
MLLPPRAKEAPTLMACGVWQSSPCRAAATALIGIQCASWVISDKPMTEAEWIKAHVIDVTQKEEIEDKSK